jgi:hypothetical protein
MRRKKNFVCDLGAFGGEDKQFDVGSTSNGLGQSPTHGQFRTCAGASALSFLLSRMDIVSREATSEKCQKR